MTKQNQQKISGGKCIILGESRGIYGTLRTLFDIFFISCSLWLQRWLLDSDLLLLLDQGR